MLKYWLGEGLVDFPDSFRKRHGSARIDSRLHGHWVGRDLVFSVVSIEVAVHANHDEIDHHADDSEPGHEIEDALRAQIFLLEAVVSVPVVQGVMHVDAPVPTPVSRRRRIAAAAAMSSDCGKSTRAKGRPSRTGSPDRPRSR